MRLIKFSVFWSFPLHLPHHSIQYAEFDADGIFQTTFSVFWRGSSVGKSGGFITRRSAVQIRPSLPDKQKQPSIRRLFFIFSIIIFRRADIFPPGGIVSHVFFAGSVFLDHVIHVFVAATGATRQNRPGTVFFRPTHRIGNRVRTFKRRNNPLITR